jgi:hypothetical protein
MTIVGKILVILNFVFVLVVIGLLIVDSATRMNYKVAYDALTKEMEIARTNQNTFTETTAKDAAEVRKLTADLDKVKADVLAVTAERNAIEAASKVQISEAERRAMEADIKTAEAIAASERFKDEVKKQLDILKQRDQVIVKQQEDFVRMRNEAVNQENARKASDARLQQALARNAELTAALTKATTGAAPNQVVKGTANPPPAFVEAKIEQVDAQSGLVQVSAGSDKGLSKNHTLEVYRTTPEPMYLGLVRLLDVQPHTSVGRIERVGAANRGPVRVGDTVSSTLSRQ